MRASLFRGSCEGGCILHKENAINSGAAEPLFGEEMTIVAMRNCALCACLLLAYSACKAGSVLGISSTKFNPEPTVTASDSGLVNPATVIDFDNVPIFAREDPVHQLQGVGFLNFYYSTIRAAGVLPSSGYISNFSNESITPQTATISFVQPVSQLSFELRSQPGITTVVFNQTPGVPGLLEAGLSTDLGGNDYYTFTDIGAVFSLIISTSSSDNGFVLDNLAFGVGPSDVSSAAPLPSVIWASFALIASLIGYSARRGLTGVGASIVRAAGPSAQI